MTGEPIPRCQYADAKGVQCERATYFAGRCFWHQPEATEHMQGIGSKGGKATGDVKVRGDTTYYRSISRLASKARKAKGKKK